MGKITLAASMVALFTAGCTTTPAPRSAPRAAYIASASTTASIAGVRITLSAEQAAFVRPYLTGGRSDENDDRGHGHGRHRGHDGGLPPGIAKNLERGKALPPGIAKGYLPANVVAGLPRLPAGLDYVVVAGKLLLVEAATAAIHDVLLDAAF